MAIWARGAAKSTSAEMACVAVGARSLRRYGLYVCSTQEKADDHVANVGGMLESAEIERAYPAMAARRIGKYGNSRGWRRNRLWTEHGFVLDALGLDGAARGVKLEEQRPDFILLDDIDGELDTPQTVARNITRLTKKVLPAGSEDVAILAVQNLVIPHGVFARLARIDGVEQADFLRDRIVSGPIPAVENLAYEQSEDGRYVITGGEATWAGQSLEIAQRQLDDWGLTAFLEEAQHDVQAPDGGMFSHLKYRHCEMADVPELVRAEVWVDPAVTNTDQSDSCGIQADGIGANGVLYRLYSWEGRTSPLDALKRAIGKAMELKCTAVGVETDQGGDTWASVYREACRALGITHERAPRFRWEKAGAGYGPKAHRAQQMLADYERGRIVHVIGTQVVLERALRRFPVAKPYDLVDAAFWAWHSLRGPKAGGRPAYSEVIW